MLLYTLLTVFSSKKEKKETSNGKNPPDEIKALRKKLSLSQKQFASRLGVRRQTVARWETGKRTPSEKIIAILKKLDTQTRCEHSVRLPRGATFSATSGQDIKELRQKLGLSQRQFASRLGVSHKLIWYWETGKKSPSKDWEAKIALLAEKDNAGDQNVAKQDAGDQNVANQDAVNQNVDNQDADDQNVDSENVNQIVDSESEVNQVVATEEGEQNVTSEEGEQNVNPSEEEQNVNSSEGEQIVTSEEGGQAENIASAWARCDAIEPSANYSATYWSRISFLLSS